MDQMLPGEDWLNAALTIVKYAYVLRIPLACAFFLLAFPWIALRRVRPLLSNLFDIEGNGLFYVTLGAVAAASMALVSGYLILLHGPARLPDLPSLEVRYLPGWVSATVIVVLTLPITLSALIYSHREGRRNLSRLIINLLLGVTVAGVIVVLAGDLYRVTQQRSPQLLTESLSLYLGGLNEQLTNLPQGVFQRLISSRLGRDLTAGYLLQDGSSVVPFKGHLLAAIAFVLTFGFYAYVGRRKFGRMGSRFMPALVYVLLLVTLGCSLLSGLSFFFDRYRIPILIPLAVWIFLTAHFKRSDHYYTILDRRSATPCPTPAEAIAAHGRDTAIVVAINGGGIQAAAWAARVLTGLEAECRKSDLPDRFMFGNSIRLISSVSGGSVGTMYFLNAYDSEAGGLPRDGAELETVVKHAEESSLDEVGWGVVYPDLLRTLFPFLIRSKIDRGYALELALTRSESLRLGLSAWHDDIKAGRRPAVIFNATLTDTGDRLLLATSAMSAEPGQLHLSADGRVNFGELYPDRDIPIRTAARLSAAFPFVSPAARADLPPNRKPEPHVVDGGYFDNYGMSSLVEWLDEALSGAPEIKRVLVLQIRGSKVQTAHHDPQTMSSRGWFYQAWAPIATLLNVRTAGQLSHNEIEYSLLQRVWQLRGKEIETVVFEFNDENPPLSWHLTASQKLDIEMVWKLLAVEQAGRVVDFLRRSSAI